MTASNSMNHLVGANRRAASSVDTWSYEWTTFGLGTPDEGPFVLDLHR
jgi:hypothetical protein